jgi:hypothetical protein
MNGRPNIRELFDAVERSRAELRTLREATEQDIKAIQAKIEQIEVLRQSLTKAFKKTRGLSLAQCEDYSSKETGLIT